MYNIALYGSSDQVAEFFEAISRDGNVTISCVITPAGNARIDEVVPAHLRTASLDVLKAPGVDVFAVLNVDNDPELPRQMLALGLGSMRVINGTSAALLYGNTLPDKSRKGDYRVILDDFRKLATNMSFLFDRDKLLNEILRGLCEQSHANRASIMLHDRHRNVLKIALAYGIDRKLWDEIEVKTGEGIAGKVAETGEPLLVTGAPDNKQYRNFLKRSEIKSALCVPLVKDKTVMGVINLASLDDPGAFTKRDIEFARNVSSVVSELLFATKSYAEYREDAQLLDIVTNVSTILSDGGSFADRLEKVAAFIHAALDVDVCVALKNDDGEQVLSAATLPQWRHGGLLSDRSIEQHVFLSRATVNFSDSSAGGFRGYLCCPVTDGDTRYGVLSFLNCREPLSRGASFFEELVKHLSRVLALAYRNEIAVEQRRKIETFDAIIERLDMCTDLESFGKSMLSCVASEIGARVGILRIFDQSRSSFVVKDVYGSDQIMRREFFKLDREAVKEALKTGQTLLVESTSANWHFSFLHPVVQSFIFYPVRVGDDTTMALSFYDCVDGRRKQAFMASDIALIRKLADRMRLRVESIIRENAVPDEPLTDPLTGLPTFRYFEQRVYEELLRARRHDKRVVLLVVEMQPYDLLVDHYGKRSADDIVKRLGANIRSSIRMFEVVSRMNKNKFGIMLVDADEKSLEVIFRLKRSFEKEVWDPKKLLGQPVRLSFGYARFPEDGDEYDELIVKANHIRK